MNRLLALLAVSALLVAPRGAHAQTVIGDLNNFDTLNDTGQTCYGFEIEIDGARATDITYTFDWNHYGAPRIAEDISDPANPKVFVRYESTKNSDGTWGAAGSFTNTALPTVVPPQGHTCTDPSVNEGCEHFGVGYYGTPQAVKYHWLVDDNAGGLALSARRWASRHRSGSTRRLRQDSLRRLSQPYRHQWRPSSAGNSANRRG